VFILDAPDQHPRGAEAASAKEARAIAEDFEARGELDKAGPASRRLPEGRELEKEPCPENIAQFITDLEEVP